jgi:hypothetical protein
LLARREHNGRALFHKASGNGLSDASTGSVYNGNTVGKIKVGNWHGLYPFIKKFWGFGFEVKIYKD